MISVFLGFRLPVGLARRLLGRLLVLLGCLAVLGRLALERGLVGPLRGLGPDGIALLLAPVLDRPSGMGRRLLDLLVVLFVSGHVCLRSLPMMDNR